MTRRPVFAVLFNKQPPTFWRAMAVHSAIVCNRRDRGASQEGSVEAFARIKRHVEATAD